MMNVARLEFEPRSDWAVDRDRLADRCRELCAACERVDLSGGPLADPERELSEAGAELAAMEDLILAMPAESLADLALKTRLIRQLPAACRQPDETDALLLILVRDIERLARC